VTLQTWVMTAAPANAEAATAVYCFVFNLAISVGVAAGGLVVDALGLPSVLWRGAGAARAADGAPGAGVRPLNATIAIGRMGRDGPKGLPTGHDEGPGSR